MSRLTIDTGTAGNAATGDSLRSAFTKVNTNFQELYAELGGDSLDAISFNNNAISTDITNANLILSGNGTGGVVIEDIGITGSTINVLTTNSNLTLDTNGTGKVIINGLSFPTADGTAGQVLKTDGAGNLSFTAVDPGAITFVGDDSTGTAVNIGESFKIAGGTGLTSVVSGDTITLDIDATVATLTGSQELTNKTITFGSNTISGTAAQFNTGVVDTDFATLDGSEVLTNKTISTASNTITGTVITLVGDDSTGTAVNIGETFKIAGAGSVTTAVSGDTITITGSGAASAQGITFVGDDSTGTRISDNETIKIAGGTGLTSVVSGDTITLDIDSTVATLTGSQELTNKTLTTPKIDLIKDANGNEILGFSTTASATDYLVVKNGIGAGVPLHIYAEGDSANIGVHLQPKGTGIFTISDGTDFNKGIRFRSSSSAASAITLIDAVSTAGRVVTLPDATDTLVGRATQDTLTNKSISLTTNTITGTVVTLVGDDSTGTAVNIGETFKIAGTSNITTAVSGDTLTITGSKNIEVNEISSGDSSAIQINDAVNVSGLLTANAGLTINNNSNTWQFGSTGNLTVPSGKGIQSAVEDGFQSAITLNPYRVLSQTVGQGNQSYSDSGDFVSATWTDNGFGSSTIAFTSPAGYVVSWISNTLPRYSSITVRINGAGAEYPYSYFNGTNEIYLTGAPAISPTAVTEIRFSYQRISKIHIEPDDAVFDIISQPGTDIDIDAGDDLRILANDDVTITAGGDLQLRSTNAASITTNYGVDSKDWQFGTDGTLTFPDSTTQNTAATITIVGDDSTGTTLNAGETFKIAGTQNITTAVSGDTLTITGTGNASTVDITNTNGIDTNYSITFVETRDVTQYLRADVDLTFNSATNLLTAGNIATNTIVVNELSSSDSSAIQINDAVNVSGAGTFHGSVRFNAGYTENINALTSSSTITVNCAAASIHTVTLAVSTGFVISNLPTGGTVTLIITQGGSGSYTATFGTDGSTTVKFPGGAPTLSTAVGAIDVVTIFNDGTNYLGNIAKAYA